MESSYLHFRTYSSLFLLLLLLIISFRCTTAAATVGSTVGGGQEEEAQQLQEQLHMEAKAQKTPIIETVKRMFSFPTTLPQTSTSYWSKFNSLIKQCKAYFSPPTLDFRDSQEAQGKEEGAGEKVKEAMIKSLDKSKEAMEDSAKSAAKLAGDAVQKTKNKVKRTFSFGDKDSGHHAEEL
ncbi:uncharacterized protein LOC107823796 [Nicotiana tabacum]|uniref:Uncharacterized protein LOC107823796 n=1 Tax=Nicotiana tabacum TaxID=4097 RepID=A0A1S4CXX9_TOBAC|nr:uncharacterized protein LOC104108870 [Nicotiana tomentosiformis]XP_016505992.1 PREDICTED: uncharacterized protein LOC107823796 [Nicotiana tabacum]